MEINASTTELQSSLHPCPYLESTWLIVHFYYTCLLSIYLGMVILPTYGFCFLISLLYGTSDNPYESLFPAEAGTYEEITRRHRLIFLKREVLFLVIYLLISTVCTWMFDIGSINSMRLTCWIIEVFFFPLMLLHTIGVRYLDRLTGQQIPRNLSVQTPVLFLHKFTQLALMRYAEVFPSSRLNDLRTLIFYRFCAASAGHQIPEDHPMKPFLKSLHRLI